MSVFVRLGVGALLVVALVLSLHRTALAQGPAEEPRAYEPDCSPCVVVIDRPAWDETQTVVDQATYDETVTVVDTPASTGTRTVIDTPAHTVSHHDLVTPATTVARQVLVTAGYYQPVATLVPAHYEYGMVWTASGYWTSVWVSAGYWAQQWVSSGYWTWQWTSSGYWGQQWVSSGYYSTQYVSSGYWNTQWVATGGHWEYDCDDVCHRYWEQDGYYQTVWVDSSYYTSVWNDTSHYESRWVDTSYWQLVWTNTSHWESAWIDTSHYEQRWTDTSSYQPGGVYVPDRYITAATYVPSGFYGYRCWGFGEDRDCDYIWTSTAYTAYPNQTWVPAVYTTVYDPVPAVYRDWTEQVPAVTHTETYTIPAVTHQATVHHNAVTHTVTVHHDALTHQEQAQLLLTQSAQGAPPAANGTVTSSSWSTTPVTIPVVSTITLIDTPATTRTVTLVDVPARDEQRTVVDKAAYDEQKTTWVSDVTTQLNTTAGAMITTFVPAVTGSLWMPMTCGWEWDDDSGRSWNCDGGYYYGAVITPAHWETSWHQGHYVSERQRECDDDGLHCYSYSENVWYEGAFYETVDRSRWVTTTVHHDAVTHQETVHIPAVTHTETQTVAAVTHTETLRYDAVVASGPAGSEGGTTSDELAAFGALLGLTALAGVGRYASRADALRDVAATWAQAGEPIPAALVQGLDDSSSSPVEAFGASTSAGAGIDAALTPGDDMGGQPNEPPIPVPGLDGIGGAVGAAVEFWNGRVREASRMLRAGSEKVGELASWGSEVLREIKGLRSRPALDIVLDVVKSPAVRGAIRAAPFVGAAVTAADEALNAPGPATPNNIAKTWARAMIRIGVTALGTTLGVLAAGALGLGTGGVGAIVAGAGLVAAGTLAGDVVGSALAASIPFLQNDEAPSAQIGSSSAVPADTSGWASDPYWSAGGFLDESSRAARHAASTESDLDLGDSSPDPWSTGGFLDESSRAMRREQAPEPTDTGGAPVDDAGNFHTASDDGAGSTLFDACDWMPADPSDDAGASLSPAESVDDVEFAA